MKRAFCQCNGGDYFVGEFCPFDGWSSAESKEIAEFAQKFEREGIDLCIENLAAAGLSKSALKLVTIVQFGENVFTFDAVCLDSLLTQKDGKWKPLKRR